MTRMSKHFYAACWLYAVISAVALLAHALAR